MSALSIAFRKLLSRRVLFASIIIIIFVIIFSLVILIKILNESENDVNIKRIFTNFYRKNNIMFLKNQWFVNKETIDTSENGRVFKHTNTPTKISLTSKTNYLYLRLQKNATLKTYPINSIQSQWFENKITSVTKKTHLTTVKPLHKITLEIKSERFWFLTNGTLKPDPLISDKLALWPHEDYNNDRVVNQLMYEPLGYNSHQSKLKTIFVAYKEYFWKNTIGREDFMECPVNTCEFVAKNRSLNADLVLFKSSDHFKKYKNTFRPPHQLWAMFNLESPESPLQWDAPENSINWTITYRHDSDISTPYNKFYPYERSYKYKNTPYIPRVNKTKKVAWFVSNCRAKNMRFDFALELAKYIEVDIYGKCGKLKCPHRSSECHEILSKDYKFYLSFENSNCMDYITEKFWVFGLKNDVIPIVMGAHPSTYKQVAPPHSYIHVDDFESPKHLAQYLKLLDSNVELYNKYFEWKGSGDIEGVFMLCRICALLHAPKHVKSYHNLREWWEKPDTCVPITWTNLKIKKRPAP